MYLLCMGIDIKVVTNAVYVKYPFVFKKKLGISMGTLVLQPNSTYCHSYQNNLSAKPC